MLLDLSAALVQNLHRHEWLSVHHLLDLVAHVVVLLWLQVCLLKLILLVHYLGIELLLLKKDLIKSRPSCTAET